MLDLAGRLLIESLNRVSELRLSPSCESVEEALATSGQGLARHQSAGLRLSVRGRARPRLPLMREEMCLIAQEGLFSAFQHADASHIEVTPHFDDEAFRVLVQTDGEGLPPDVTALDSKPGQWGLSGMRERARLTGGSFTPRSDAANGMLIGVSAACAASLCSQIGRAPELAPASIAHMATGPSPHCDELK